MSTKEIRAPKLYEKVTVVDASELAEKKVPRQNGATEGPYRSGENSKRKRDRRRKKKKAYPCEDLEADKAAIAKIKERFLRPQYDRGAIKRKSRRRTVKTPTIVVHDDNVASAKIYNTAAHDKSITAIKNFNARHFMRPSFLADLIPLPDICALCQEADGYENLGFLCGPYYIQISTSEHWPPFAQEDAKPHDEPMMYEAGLKFHVRCLATAPELERLDKFIIGIQEYMPKYWKQCCHLCDCVGATVCCSGNCGRKFHYPCAVGSGRYDLINSVFTCDSCDTDKK